MEDQPMTYAIGDLHGEVTLFRRLLALLPIREEDTLVFLGDCLDRGEDSVATILALRELKRTHPACIFLRGNHEDAWLACWNGARFIHAPDIEGALQVWDDCDGAIPFAVGDWLEETRIEYEDDYAYYVHAGLLPGKSLSRTSDFYKMWGVKGFLESRYDWGKPVVFGHWNLPEPLVQPNKIGIDTGAFRRGRLTALRLPDRRIFQVQRESCCLKWSSITLCKNMLQSGYKVFLILCEYVCQRGQQAVKRCERVSGLDFGLIASYSSCSGHNVHCLICAHSSVRSRRLRFGPGISPSRSFAMMLLQAYLTPYKFARI